MTSATQPENIRHRAGQLHGLPKSICTIHFFRLRTATNFCADLPGSKTCHRNSVPNEKNKEKIYWASLRTLRGHRQYITTCSAPMPGPTPRNLRHVWRIRLLHGKQSRRLHGAGLPLAGNGSRRQESVVCDAETVPTAAGDPFHIAAWLPATRRCPASNLVWTRGDYYEQAQFASRNMVPPCIVKLG